ncbi:MAG: hypothetical protein ABFC62_05385 [Clostridiaceae bacterium]|nr:hypothetical protein [Eubacteriales bacterium]
MKKRDENDICDLDPSKICDNCCKCLEQPEELTDVNGYRVIAADFCPEEEAESLSEPEQVPVIAALFRDEEEEEEEIDELGPLDIPPALMAEWEAKLAASFREEEEARSVQPKLRGSRKKRG